MSGQVRTCDPADPLFAFLPIRQAITPGSRFEPIHALLIPHLPRRRPIKTGIPGRGRLDFHPWSKCPIALRWPARCEEITESAAGTGVPLMNWTGFFISRLTQGRLSASALQTLAESLAEQGLPAVVQRSLHRATWMRLSEARGYIRARAAQVIHDRVDAELQHRPAAHARYRSEIIERATEAVISLTIREMVSHPAEQRRGAKAA